MREAVAQFSRAQAHRRGGVGRLREPPPLLLGQLRRPRDTTRSFASSSTRSTDANGTRGNRIFYLAIPPSAFLDRERQPRRGGARRRPSDATTLHAHHHREAVRPRPRERATRSTPISHRVFDETQIYRIDHYLGKETVQNLLVFRFANAIFEPLWNRQHIDHVQITVAEDIGVEGRGKYYEEAGDDARHRAEPPAAALDGHGDGAARRLRRRRGARREGQGAARARARCVGEDVARLTVRGQYGAGNFAGEPVPGYRDEPDVSADSRIETYVAMRARNRQLALGGRARSTSARASGSPSASPRSRSTSSRCRTRSSRDSRRARIGRPNVAPLMRIQPDEGIALRFIAKVPGPHDDAARP